MTISILLLVLLQAYWLRNASEDEYRRLKRELGILLRETVMQEELKHFVFSDPLDQPADSGKLRLRRRLFRNDKYVDTARSGTNINIVVSSDSGHILFPPRNMNFDQQSPGDDGQNLHELIIEYPALVGNSNLDSLNKSYENALEDANLPLHFTLKKIKIDSTHFRGEFKIKKKRGFNPERLKKFNAEVIQANFGNPTLLLFQKIKWQIFFAFMMLVVTSVAFLFLYRNLRTQQRLAELKNDFIANITHELKTPIATVSVAIEALKNFDAIHDQAKMNEYLNISSNELQRLNLLVDKVLKMSMLGEQKIQLQREEVDVEILLKEVVNSLRLQCEKQAAVVNLSVEGAIFKTIGDRMHLLSVFYNLLDNAMKYSPVKTHIDILLTNTPNAVQVKITDNGIGIAEMHRRKIFDQFFRVPHGNTHNIKGYGLGLSYVQEVLRSHGGTISVDSEENKGSTFTVRLVKA